MKIKTVLWGLATAALLVSCSGAKLSVANEQYARGEFYDAAQTYRKVYSKTNPRKERKLRGEIAFKMAECYRRINMAPRSSAAYQNAIRYDYPDSMALFYLARSQQYEGKYKEAIKNYQAYLETNPQSSLAKNGIRGCNLAQQWKKTPTRYVVKKATMFNSRRSDFAPMFLGEDFDQVYFSSSTEKALGKNKSGITGTKNCDLFFSKKNERGAWQKPEPIEGDVNTEDDEGVISFSPDGTTMYLTKARRRHIGRDLYFHPYRRTMERPAKIRNNGRHPIGIRPPGGITRRRIPLFRVGHAGRLWREGHLAYIVNRERGYSRKFRCTNQYTGRRNVPLYPVER